MTHSRFTCALFLVSLLAGAFLLNIFPALAQKTAADDITTIIASPGVAPSTTVDINEIYGASETAGNVYNADFIELYNRSTTPVDISDWSVQYYTAGQINGGAPTSTAHIPAGTILAGNAYYVIRAAPSARPARLCRARI